MRHFQHFLELQNSWVDFMSESQGRQSKCCYSSELPATVLNLSARTERDVKTL